MIRRVEPSAEIPLPLLITGVPGYNALAYFAAKYPGQVVGRVWFESPPAKGDSLVVAHGYA